MGWKAFDHGMAHPGRMLRNLRNQRSLSTVALAELAGVDKDTVNKYENSDDWSSFKKSTVKAVLEALRVDPVEFNRAVDCGDEPSDGIPLHDGIPASPPRFVGAADNVVGTIPRDVAAFLHLNNPNIYACRVFGESMAPTYHNNDVVLLNPDAVRERGVISGRVYAVWFNSGMDEGATLKRVIVNADGTWTLKADNESIEPITVNPSDIGSMALVVAVVRIDTDNVAL